MMDRVIAAAHVDAPQHAARPGSRCGPTESAAPSWGPAVPAMAPECAAAAVCPLAPGPGAAAHDRFEPLESSPVPVVFCRRSLAVVYANPAAHRLMAVGCGILVANGRLLAAATDAHAWLARTVSTLASGGEGHDMRSARMIAPPDRGPAVLAIVVAQARRDAEPQSAPDAMVILHRPEPRLGPATAVLAASFGLTDGEIRVLGALVSGGALTAVARQLRIGHETVRSHLKSIFAKTGTHRQGELIALVLALSSLPWPRR